MWARITLAVLLIYPITVFSQHEPHSPEGDTTGHQEHEHHDHSGHDMDMNLGDDAPDMGMVHSYSRNLPMNRNGSGTGWLPDESPLYAYMTNAGAWHLMFHGAAFLRYNSQNLNNKNRKGNESAFGMPNWAMMMAQRKTGNRGLFNFNLMLSLDRLTEGGDGYPLLFQTGELWEGEELVDRQHPHDFTSELSVAYTHMISDDIDVTGYLGYPGEPAIGPVAFMHRPSALSNPDATLGHHWQDATHIVYGVATLGWRYKNVKAEGSVFTGREPDENRFVPDMPRFDSYSYRLSYNPLSSLALQFSQAWIKEPEVSHPGEDVLRTTASVLFSKHLSGANYLATGVIYGLNNVGQDGKQNSVTVEANFLLSKVNPYLRYEFIQKSSEELQIPGGNHHQLNEINAFTLGLAHKIFDSFNTDFYIGAQGTVNFIHQDLEKFYGPTPLSAELYLRISPSILMMDDGHSGH